MHVFPEKAIEVPHFSVTEYRCNHADLRRRKDAEQPLRKSQADVDLEFKRCFVVLGNEVALQRSHLYSDLAGDRAEAQLNITVIDQHEMVHKACWIVEQYRMKIVVWRCSQRTELSDYFSLDGRQLFGGTTSHEEFLKAKRRLSFVNGRILMHSPRPAKGDNSRALANRTLPLPGGTSGNGAIYAQPGSTRVAPLHFRRPLFGNKACISVESTTGRCQGWFCNSCWEQVELSWALFLLQPRRCEARHRISLSAKRADIKQELLDPKRRLCRRRSVNRIEFVANTSGRGWMWSWQGVCGRRSSLNERTR
jgi:hypothetical protein